MINFPKKKKLNFIRSFLSFSVFALFFLFSSSRREEQKSLEKPFSLQSFSSQFVFVQMPKNTLLFLRDKSVDSWTTAKKLLFSNKHSVICVCLLFFRDARRSFWICQPAALKVLVSFTLQLSSPFMRILFNLFLLFFRRYL